MNKNNPCDMSDQEAHDVAVAAFALLKSTTPPETGYGAGRGTLSSVWYDGEKSDGAGGTSMWCRARVPTGDFFDIRFTLADIKRATKPGRPDEIICYMRDVIQGAVKRK